MSNTVKEEESTWKKSKPPKLVKMDGQYRLKSGEMMRGLKEFNKASFAETNADVKMSLDMTKYTTELSKIYNSAYKFEKHSGYGRDYPGSPMIDETFKLADGELDALLKFKSNNPFQAKNQDWLDLLQTLFIDLANVRGHKPPAVMHTGVWESREGISSFYTPHIVVLTGAKSLITALHEYTHSIGYGEVVAVWWSTNAFRIIFPNAFARLEQHPEHPHLMIRKVPQIETETEEPEIVEIDLDN
jgi:hypothetical protein